MVARHQRSVKALNYRQTSRAGYFALYVPLIVILLTIALMEPTKETIRVTTFRRMITFIIVGLPAFLTHTFNGRPVFSAAARAQAVQSHSDSTEAESAQNVLDQLSERLRSAQTLRAQLIVNPGDDATTFEVCLNKPDLYLVRSKSQGFVRDGAAERLWMTANKTYYQLPLSSPPVPPFLCVGLEDFFNKGLTYRAERLEAATLDGVACRKLYLTKPGVSAMHWTIYIDGDGMPIGWEQKPDNSKLALIQGRYKDLRLNIPIPLGIFAWEAQGYKLKIDFGAQAPTLAVGDTAPVDTAAISLDGKPVALQTLFRGKKAVLLNFWFVGCSPCRDEFPYLQKLNERFSSRGLAVIGVDRGDSAAHVRAFVQEQQGTFPIVLDPSGQSVVERYRVNAFPTSYLLTPDGKIRSVIVGEDTAKLDAALATMGFESPAH